MEATFTSADEAKPVVDASGEHVGRIRTVEDETAYVDPESGLTETFLSMLGWAEADEHGDGYALRSDAVDEITDHEVLLKSF